MTEIAFLIIGFCGGIVCQREGWRVEHLIRMNWPTRCAVCGACCRYRNTYPVKQTTGYYGRLCDACCVDEYHPFTRDPQT